MRVELKVLTRNESTALPRILRLVARQSCLLKKLILQPHEEEGIIEILLLLDCPESPMRLIKLLQKQISVTEVQLLKEEISQAI